MTTNFNDRVVVAPVRKTALTKEYIDSLRREVKAKMDLITKKPTLQELFAQVDTCWNNPVFVRQTNFQNKDQHYNYVSELYKEHIEKATLEEYKKMVFADIMAKLDSAEGLVEADKVYAAAKEHKKQQAEHLAQYQNQVDDLRERNESITKDMLKKIEE